MLCYIAQGLLEVALYMLVGVCLLIPECRYCWGKCAPRQAASLSLWCCMVDEICNHRAIMNARFIYTVYWEGDISYSTKSGIKIH